MQRLQKRAIKTITKYQNNPRRELSRMLTVESIYSYFYLVKLYRVLNENNHVYFRDRMRTFQVNHELLTRFKTQLELTAPFLRKTKCMTSFLYQSISGWNRLPYVPVLIYVTEQGYDILCYTLQAAKI